MPTIEQLHSRLEYLVDDKVESDRAIDLFNEALEDMSQIGDYEQESVLTVSGGETTIPLPDGFISLIGLYIAVNGGEFLATRSNRVREDKYYGRAPNRDHYRFEEFPESLRLLEAPKDDYTATIRYLSNYPEIPKTTKDPSLQYVPKLPSRFHRALPLFAAFRYYENWEDNGSMRQELYDQYNNIKRELDQDAGRRSMKRRNNRVVITREWS